MRHEHVVGVWLGRLLRRRQLGACDATATDNPNPIRQAGAPNASITITGPAGGVTTTVRTNTSINTVDYTPGVNQKHGWRLALGSNGERVVGDGGFVADQRFHFSTTVPNYNNGTGNPLRDNWAVEVNYLTGTAPTTPFYDMNLDGQLDDNDRISASGAPVMGQTGIPVSRRIVAGGVISQPLLASL